MTDKQHYTITDAEIQWAFPFEPNKRSKKYQIDFCNLSEKDTKGLKALGLKIKQKEGKGNHITVKSKLPMKVLGEDGEPINQDVRIANGSIAKAIIYSYDWNFEGEKGKSPGMIKCKVTTLKEYVGDVGFDDEPSSPNLSDMKDDIPF